MNQQMELMQDMVAQTAGERDEAQTQMGRLAEAIEQLVERTQPSLSKDRSPADPY